MYSGDCSLAKELVMQSRQWSVDLTIETKETKETETKVDEGLEENG